MKNLRKYAMNAAVLGLLFFTLDALSIPVTGSSEGTFVNPTGSDPFLDNLSGVGTNSIEFGKPASYAGPSTLTFEGNGFAVNTGNFFSLGTLKFFNGLTYSGTANGNIDLSIVTTLTNPVGVFDDIVFNLGLFSPLGADFVKISPEDNTSTFTVDGTKFVLKVVGFAQSSIYGGLKLIDKLVAKEKKSASAFLIGKIKAYSVPEPGMIGIILLGLIGIFFIRRRVPAAA